jgi:hypothetical protein
MMANGSTRLRLAESDRAKIEAIRDRYGLPSASAAIRYAVEALHLRTPLALSQQNQTDQTLTLSTGKTVTKNLPESMSHVHYWKLQWADGTKMYLTCAEYEEWFTRRVRE